MSEVASALFYEDVNDEEIFYPPDLRLIITPEQEALRPPKLTAEEAEYELARGPYVGRLAAQTTLLAFAEREHLPDYVTEKHQSLYAERLEELTAFDASYEIRSEEPSAPEDKHESKVPETEPKLIDPVYDSNFLKRMKDEGLCGQTDPEAFFPEKGGSTREAKKVCLGCDIRFECLEYALANGERFGIWGGLSERERRKLIKRAV